ncbi:hypothetical protein PkoCFBP13504_21095 [Pseudomonas koreensis]|nr:hypothetical protein CCX46_19720 [Pseudomonas sp. RU47]TKJ79276.1 hypothetical protein PkoCFBP13504_21095 [Pseudomonas koreensis]
MIVPTLCVGMPLVTLCVTLLDAERPGLHSHAERGNDPHIEAQLLIWRAVKAFNHANKTKRVSPKNAPEPQG